MSKRNEVTTSIARRMKELRAAGQTWFQIAVETGFSPGTVMRHVDPNHAEKQRQAEKRRYHRDKQKRALKNDDDISQDDPSIPQRKRAG